MSSWDDSIASLTAARDDLVAAAKQSGYDSRNDEVATLDGKIATLQQKLDSLDPFASFYQLEAPSAGSTASVQAAVQKAMDTHGEVTLGPGDWDVEKTGLTCVDSQHLHLHDDQTNLWRNYSSGNGTQQAFIRNRDFSKPIQGLSFTGPGNIAARNGKTGCVFGLKADDLINDGWGTSYWTKGRHTQSVGNGHRYLNPKPWRCDLTDGSGSGGLRWGGGDDFYALGLDIYSMDDGLQVVPPGGSGDPLTNYADATNAIYENCIARSGTARPFVVGLQTDGKVTMTVSIRGVKFIKCYGYGGGSGTNIANHSPSTGVIDGVLLDHCTVDQQYAGTAAEPNHGQPNEFWVQREPGTGLVDNVDASTSTFILSSRRKGRDKPLYKPQPGVGTNVKPPMAA